MPKVNLSDTEQVSEFIDTLEKPVAEAVKLIRQIFLSADVEIAERIKWNSTAHIFLSNIFINFAFSETHNYAQQKI